MTMERLFANNKAWVSRKTANDPDFFQRLVNLQKPEYLWIGCSDSRVPANDIVDLAPGELFVHRNVANLVVPSDLNMLTVLQYAVDVLKVRHVMVVGHYGCGGVKAALSRAEMGLIDNWLQPIKQIMATHRSLLDGLDDSTRLDRLCELNVVAQARNVAATSIVQTAWTRGQNVQVHGLIYALNDGRLKDLGCTLSAPDHLEPAFRLIHDGG
ncbi:carbonate dehydratase [Rhodospira trueperi]|uniref:Carbonic anhydrase n=1 Tax=Rhodospira trueperi TaxID=69960 RepID=A0A1G7F4M0_9PROT|nr:carbonate dehydratase [Rhodospira trueperi]SDE70827.1 carbonic anhydrase [Rhodospira trueperi]